jgi:hypothetical protein
MRSGSVGRSFGAIVRSCAGPGCFTYAGTLPAVSVVPDAVLEDTKRFRSSFVPARIEVVG